MMKKRIQHKLGYLGYLNINENGELIDVAVAGKQQSVKGMQDLFSTNYRNACNIDWDKSRTAFSTDNKPGYYSFVYFSAPSGNRFIYNDLTQNMKQEESVANVAVGNMFDANCTSRRIVPRQWAQSFVFVSPTDRKNTRLAYLSSGDYDATTATYAVLMIRRTGKQKVGYVAWVSLK